MGWALLLLTIVAVIPLCFIASVLLDVFRHTDRAIRKQYVKEARAASFLDAVFLIFYYNNEVKRWGGEPKPPDISPYEVFAQMDRAVYQSAYSRAEQMYSKRFDLGAAFFKYPGATRSYGDELAHFRNDNPGFSDRCYALAAEAGTRAMR